MTEVGDEILQALRRSHCSDGRGSKCMGRLTVTPNGIELSCQSCGDDRHDIADHPGLERAREILAAAGVELDALSPERQAAVAKRCTQDICPGCHRLGKPMAPYDRSRACACGRWVFTRGPWGSGGSWREIAEAENEK